MTSFSGQWLKSSCPTSLNSVKTLQRNSRPTGNRNEPRNSNTFHYDFGFGFFWTNWCVLSQPWGPCLYSCNHNVSQRLKFFLFFFLFFSWMQWSFGNADDADSGLCPVGQLGVRRKRWTCKCKVKTKEMEWSDVTSCQTQSEAGCQVSLHSKSSHRK